MKSVNVADLKDNLNSYLHRVIEGEEILIRNRNMPVAKIIPLRYEEDADSEEVSLAAEGKLRLAEKKMSREFWKRFWSLPAPEVSFKDAVEAVLADRKKG